MNSSPVFAIGQTRRLRPALGTLVEIAAEGEAAEAALNAAYAAIEAVEAAASFFRADSALVRLNHAAPGAEIALDEHLAALLELAAMLEIRSAGAFNANLGARRTAPAMNAAPARMGESLELLPDRRARVRQRVNLDLGGLAKGYAVDCALAALVRAGAVSGSVNAGGDIAVFGRAVRISVRSPADWRQPAQLIELRDAALATSAAYAVEGPFHGCKGLAIFDRDGHALGQSASVTVMAPRCALADGLTKVLWVERARMGATCDHPLLTQFGAMAWWVEKEMLGKTRGDA